MEELSGLIPIIIIAVVSAIAKSSKNQKAQQKRQHPYGGMSAARPAAPVTQPASMASMLPQQPHIPMQPTVHTHLNPDCDIHDAPTSGSLGAIRTEGTDPCHEEQLSVVRTAAQTPAQQQPGLALEWSGDALIKSFVMQEVLTRPCQRRR